MSIAQPLQEPLLLSQFLVEGDPVLAAAFPGTGSPPCSAGQVESAGTDSRVSILVVDDEPQTCELVATWLSDAGYHSAMAHSAEEALDFLAAHDVHLLTCDVQRSGRNGLELLSEIHARFPEVAVIVLTRSGDAQTAAAAMASGASGYLVKPVKPEEVVHQAQRALERRLLLLQRRRYQSDLEATVHRQNAKIREAHEETVVRLLAACALRDDETGAHAKRTGLLAALLAEACGWPVERVAEIRLAAPMHDIGKIAIPDSILRKPGALTGEQRKVMEKHTLIGARLLSQSTSPVLQLAHDIALSHHEHWDGGGYPRALAGRQVPEPARIVAIVDVFDALSHDRVYRPALPWKQVSELLNQGRASHFDPELLDVFLDLIPEACRISAEHPDERPADDGLLALCNFPGLEPEEWSPSANH